MLQLFMLFFIFIFAVASWKTDLKFLPTCSFPQLSGAGIPESCRATSPRAPHALQRRAAPGDSAARACPHLTGGLLSGPPPATGRAMPSSSGSGAHPRSLTPAAPTGVSSPVGSPACGPHSPSPSRATQKQLGRLPGRGWTCAWPPQPPAPARPPSLAAPSDLLCLSKP